jgi:hypothetical protein
VRERRKKRSKKASRNIGREEERTGINVIGIYLARKLNFPPKIWENREKDIFNYCSYVKTCTFYFQYYRHFVLGDLGLIFFFSEMISETKGNGLRMKVSCN